MRTCSRIALFVLAVAGAQARAQAQDEVQKLPMRVTAAARGAIVIDRGSRDALRAGDRVNFFPRLGGAWRGTIRQVDERSAIVSPDEPDFLPEPGTRGEVLVPRDRAVQSEPDPSVPGVSPVAPVPPIEHPPWEERRDDWQTGMPLLAKVRPIRPAERAMRTSGRVYALGDLTRSATDDRGASGANSFLRIGSALTIENALGRGDVVDVDLELANSAGFDDDHDTRLILRAFSYREGGTRFQPNRWQLGRFLQYAMPEFGVVDGFEWSRRTDEGHRFGASIGYQPNPDDDLSTGDDFQLATSFHWAADPQELLTFDIGYQKTFHTGDADRDLFVVKSRLIAGEGWDVYGTALIDGYFQSRDAAKGQSLELTQAFATLRRFFDDGSGWDLTYRHRAFPLTLRDEFEPVTADEIDDDRTDLLALAGQTGAPGTDRWLGELSGWADERDAGGAVEAGRGIANVFFDDDELELRVFGSLGSFESIVGARITLGRNTDDGRWDLLYEFANHHLDGRDDDADDLLQHRFRGSRSFYLESGWSLSFHGDAVLWDDDIAWSAGFHVQRAF